MKRILIYLGVGGSGGYNEYLRGIFCNQKTWGTRHNFVIIGGAKLIDDVFADRYKNMSNFTFYSIDLLSSNKKLLRIGKLGIHLWIKYIFKPHVIFLPSGFYILQQVYIKNVKIVSCCHNLLLFRDDIINSDIENRKYFMDYSARQKKIFKDSSDIIYFSDYSKSLVHASYTHAILMSSPMQLMANSMKWN